MGTDKKSFALEIILVLLILIFASVSLLKSVKHKSDYIKSVLLNPKYENIISSITIEVPDTDNLVLKKAGNIWYAEQSSGTDIEEKIILNHPHLDNNTVKKFLIYYKRKEFNIVTKPKKVFLKSGDYNINKLHKHILRFDYINIKNRFISFSGTFISSCYPEVIKIEAIKKSKNKDNEIFQAKYVDYGNAINCVNKFLSIDWKYTYHFNVEIPINEDEESKISFRVIYDEKNIVENEPIIMNNNIKFRYQAPLSDLNSYFIKNSRILKFKGKNFYTFPYTFSSFIKNELITMKKILFSDEESSFNAFLFRVIYLISFTLYSPLTIN